MVIADGDMAALLSIDGAMNGLVVKFMELLPDIPGGGVIGGGPLK